MDLRKAQKNPFVLAAEGFVAGAILFFATAPAEDDAAANGQTARTAATQVLIDA